MTKIVPGLLRAAPDPEHVAREAASRIVQEIRSALRDRGAASIALSGGSSPIGAYRLLARETLDWNRVHVYWVDERAVPPTHERSNFRAAKEALLDPAGVPASSIHRMRGELGDLDAAAAAYDTELRETIPNKAGGVPVLDVVVLGVGDDGHTASLFPGEPTLHVTDRLVAAVPATPTREARLTLTIPMLECARASTIVAVGASKHEALERVWTVSGSIDETPARIVRSFRGSITWVIDRAAAGI